MALKAVLRRARSSLMTLSHTIFMNRLNMKLREGRDGRRLEIGPGVSRIKGFETVNISWTPVTDFVFDVSKGLPFGDDSFEIIYASHVVEHIPWYKRALIFAECYRVLKPGGSLEVWVPDGLKICKAFVNAEEQRGREFEEDGWYKFNERRDPAVWANSRIFSYGDGTGSKRSPNWHLSIYSPRLLELELREAGFLEVRSLERHEVRGYDHGWINLGRAGRKLLY